MLSPFRMNRGSKRDEPLSEYRIGDILQQRARGVVYSYRLMRIEDCTTRRGKPSQFLTWLGGCAICGLPGL